MVQRIKRWESPRRQGRNHKGKGGSARRRQLKKRNQMLRQKLKNTAQVDNQDKTEGKRTKVLFPFLLRLDMVTRKPEQLGKCTAKN